MTVREVVDGVRWYFKELSGEAKWDGYLEDCARQDCAPMSRREFERQRADHAERHPGARCC